jgi:hypothetical protein
MEEERVEVCRTLEDGWANYAVNWRNQVAVEHVLSGDDAGEVLSQEPDPFVRQQFLSLTGGRCVDAAAFRFAENCQANRTKNVATATIEALAVAGHASAEIATRMQTRKENVLTYLKLHFDISRFSTNRPWLNQVINGEGRWTGNDAVSVKARTLLNAALHGGRRALDLTMGYAAPQSAGAIEEATAAVKSILAARAQEFMLGRMALPADVGDLQRFLELQRIPTVFGRDDSEQKMKEFGLKMIEIVHGKTGKSVGTPSRATPRFLPS